MTPPADFNLYLITDRLNLPAGKDLFTQVEAALSGGVHAVQLREKDLPAEELLPLARQMRELTRKYNAKLLINREIATALEVGADGVHLGGDAMTVAEARKLIGPDRLIGVSTHSIDEVRQTEQDGADFVTFGPIFATPSKLPYGQPVGLEALRQVVDTMPSGFPVFALGGVNTEKIQKLLDVGCQRVACISEVLFAEDVELTAREIFRQLSR